LRFAGRAQFEASELRLPPPAPRLHLRLEHLRACRALHDTLAGTADDRLQPSLNTLRTYQAVGTSGLPAPYTGIKAYI